MFAAFENPGQLWSSVGFTYKFFLIATSTLFVISLINATFLLYLIDIPLYTVWGLQLWRLFFGFLLTMPTLFSLLNILFSFMWMIKFFKDEQRKSSVYMFWEILIINFEIHLLFNILSLFVMVLFNQIELIGYGWFPIIIVYEFRQAQIDPEGSTRFCCLPCLIKKKHFPYILLLIFLLLSNQGLCILSSGIIGLLQQKIRKNNLIKLPYKFYVGFQKILCSCIKKHPNYTPISSVESNVKLYSCGGAARNTDNSEPSTFSNPFGSGQNSEQKKEEPKVNSAGKGVKIDTHSSKQVDFKSYWAFKQEEQKKKKEGNSQEYEIEPELPAVKQQQNQHEGYNQFMDSSAMSQSKQLDDIEAQKKRDEKENSNDLL